MTTTGLELGRRLMNSHWPKCNVIAEELAQMGTVEAKQSLRNALRAKRHHVRTAAIKALQFLKDVESVGEIERHLADPAYETRMAAKQALELLTGRSYETPRGE